MDILPRRRTEKEVPALIANNKVVQNATQYTSITQKIEQQRQEDINTAQTKINEENKVYQALLDFNTQQLRESLKNPPIIQEPIDFDYVPQTG
jgi:hypothetical protein